MQTQITTVTPMREDPPQTAATIAAAIRQRDIEREDVKRQCGIHFDGDRPYLPAKVLTFAQREADAIFTAPSALDTVHILQLEESQRAADLSAFLAPLAYGRDLYDITCKQRADVQFSAVRALREQSPTCKRAAQARAIEAAVVALRTEGGAAFRLMPMADLDALARLLFDRMLAAHTSLMEGTASTTPAEYLRIFKGDGK